MKKYYDKYIVQHEQVLVLGVFLLAWIALFLQHINIGMFFDDYGNASLSYGYQVPGIVGTDFGVRAIWEWASWIYMNWGGRLLYACLFLIPMLKNGIELFMIVQSFVIVFILYSLYRMVCRITNKKTSVIAAIFICILYCLIHISFHNNGTYWASASVLYIWPLLPMFCAVIYYNHIMECIKNGQEYNKICFYIIESILIMFTTLSQEQWGGALVVFFLFYIIFHHIKEEKKYLKTDLYVLIFSIGTYSLMIFSPGNMARMTGDQAEFSKLSVGDKIATNLPILLDIFVSNDLFWITLLLMISNIFLSLILVMNNKKKVWNVLLLVMSTGCFIIYFILRFLELSNLVFELFCVFFLVVMAVVSFSYFAEIKKLEYFAFLMAAIASVFCLVFSPYIVYRSYMGYIFMAFTYIAIAFQSMLNQQKYIFKSLAIGIIACSIAIGLKNYAVILHGYYENNYITKYNVKQLRNWDGASYISLYRYPQEYSMYRNMSFSDPTDYSGVITQWVRRYYGISESVYFIWSDLDKNYSKSVFLENGSGIYPTENLGESTWNWMKKDSTLNLYNFNQEDIAAELILTIETPQTETGRISLKINDQEFVYEVDSHTTDLKVPVELKKGQTNVFISADVKQADSGIDSRDLYCKIMNERLVPKE